MKNYLQILSGKKVLVTGGLGFVGHNLVKTLVEQYQCEVTVVDNCLNSQVKILGGLANQVKLHTFSVLDYEKLYPLIDQSNYIFHLACVQISASSKNPLEDLRVNAESTLMMLDYIKHNRPSSFERFVYTSSCSIYGSAINNFPAREDGPVGPISHYASTKMLGENYTIMHHKLYGIPVSSVRYSNVYGYGQSPLNPYCGVLGKFIHSALNNDVCTIIGDGEQTRDYTFITDAISATILSAVHPQAVGEVFNVGTGVETSVNKLFELIHGFVPSAKVSYIPERDIDNIRRRVTNIEKIHQKLGWTPNYTIKRGLEETINWYKGFLESKS